VEADGRWWRWLSAVDDGEDGGRTVEGNFGGEMGYCLGEGSEGFLTKYSSRMSFKSFLFFIFKKISHMWHVLRHWLLLLFLNYSSRRFKS
jgi:hypothetical protein